MVSFNKFESEKKGLVVMMESIWKEPILKILKNHYPNEVQLQIIYKEIEDYITLTNYLKEPWKDNLQPRYQCWIRKYLSILKKEGLVENVKRGYWRGSDSCSGALEK